MKSFFPIMHQNFIFFHIQKAISKKIRQFKLSLNLVVESNNDYYTKMRHLLTQAKVIFSPITVNNFLIENVMRSSINFLVSEKEFRWLCFFFSGLNYFSILTNKNIGSRNSRVLCQSTMDF